MLKILLLDAYSAASHRYWQQGLMNAFCDCQWTLLTLPPRHFSWRIRGNPLSWFSECEEVLRADYDLVIATSMVDLATLKGLCPHLGRVPTLCYFHENQFEYPKSLRQHPGVEPQMVNLYSALAADRILFNSEFNRRTFMSGADRLMSKLPDHRPRRFSSLVEGRCAVVPVPLNDDLCRFATAQKEERFTLVWNHRWEYDKAPERLLAALERALELGVDFDLHLMGERFRRYPPVMERIRESLGSRLLSWGYVESPSYYRLLARAHSVLSTSLHEFQGLAVQEGAALGASPLVPDRLSYSELFPERCRYASYPEDPKAEAEAMASGLARLYQLFCSGQPLTRLDTKAWLWSGQRSVYAAEMGRTLGKDLTTLASW